MSIFDNFGEKSKIFENFFFEKISKMSIFDDLVKNRKFLKKSQKCQFLIILVKNRKFLRKFFFCTSSVPGLGFPPEIGQ